MGIFCQEKLFVGRGKLFMESSLICVERVSVPVVDAAPEVPGRVVELAEGSARLGKL